MADRPPRRRRRWILPVAVVGALAIAAVVVLVVAGGGEDSAAPCPGADGRSRELRRCLADSLAYVETPVASGSGVLIDGGYVITNAHVVDPFGRVDVTFDGGTTFEDVVVVGVDAFADIAVLGPVDTDRRPLRLDPIPDFDDADEPDVFLAGFPGGLESDEPEITLAGGILSRLRDDESFDLTYLQTDAAIAGGQSGGALVDEDGTLLGISGLSFAEEFALALSTDDVAAAVARITAGDVDERRVMPTLEAAATDATRTELTADHPTRMMVIPADDRPRDVELVVSPSDDVIVEVMTLWGETIGVNEAGADWLGDQAAQFDDDSIADVDQLDEPRPGHFTFEAPELEDVVVYLQRESEDVTTQLSADVPFEVFDDVLDGETVTVGSPYRGVVDGFTFEVIHPIDLEAGETVEISVRGGTSDAYFTLLEPGEDYDREAEPDADDGGGGLYELDPRDTFEIERSGEYRIVVGTWEGLVGGYELEVRRAD